MAQPDWLIVGLGNPGPDYSLTRHNIGFMAADILAAELAGGNRWQKKFKAEILAAEYNGKNLTLIKPQTFMNLSGESVGEALRFYKLVPAQVIVLHDEIDLPAGEVRVKQGGGAAGHNGLKSIDAHIGKDYWRVRFGVGRPIKDENTPPDQVSNYVLGHFSKADKIWLEPLLDRLPAALPALLKGDAQEFVKQLSSRAV